MLELVNIWPGSLLVILGAPLLAIGTPMEHMGSHTVCIRSIFNVLEGYELGEGGEVLGGFGKRENICL